MKKEIDIIIQYLLSMKINYPTILHNKLTGIIFYTKQHIYTI